MARDRRPDIRLVLGRGGSGKSHLAKHWIARLKGRILIHDTAAEPDYATGAAITERPAELVRLLRSDVPRICWRGLDPGAWEFVNRAAWCAENLTLVWEEVDSFFPPGPRPEWAFKILNQGRHRGLRVIACARRPARVSRDVSANASRIVAFHSSEPADVKYLRDAIGEGAAQLPRLAQYQAIDWRPGAGARVRKSPFL